MRLLNDSQWRLSAVDGAVSRIRIYEGQLKRTLLFAMSSYRAARQRRAIGAGCVEHRNSA
jgi:hypothetical protein